MFDQPGIDLDRDLPWIHRDQYVYYLEMADHLGGPTDWASFRRDLAEALAAAFTLERTPPWPTAAAPRTCRPADGCSTSSTPPGSATTRPTTGTGDL